jgi:hypothetical protein
MRLPNNTSLAVLLVAIGTSGCSSDSASGNGSAVGGQAGDGSGGNASGGLQSSTGGRTEGSGGSSTQAGGTSGSGTSGAGGGSTATGGRSAGGATNAQGGNSTPGVGGTTTGQGGKTSLGLGGSTTSRGGADATGGIAGNAGSSFVSEGGGSSTGGTSVGTGGTSVGMGGTSIGTGGTEAAGGTSSATCTSFATPSKVGTIQSSTLYTTVEVKQLSGMVASRDNANTLYGQCDSDANLIFVFNETGESLGAITLAGITPEDWEDLSIGVVSGTDFIYVADIGDNSSSRASIVVHRFPEPAPSDLLVSTELSISSVESVTFVYPDNAHNAEAFIVDPQTQDMLIVTKENTGTALVFRAPATAFGESGTTTLEKLGEIPTGASGSNASQVGGGDISPSGDAVILRTYGSILLFPRLSTWTETFLATPITVPSPTEQQSEGITFNMDGTAWFSAGETDDSLYEGISSCH